MPRDGSDARLRLQHAAVQLFSEQGYDATTTAQIAAHAGVTERTYFRHFIDKREVLFDGQLELTAVLTRAVVDARPDLAPLAVLHRALLQVAPLIEGNRLFNEPRAKIIAGVPALRERELAKVDALTSAVASAFVERGLAHTPSILVAQFGVAALGEAVRLWLAGDAQDLTEHLAVTLNHVDALLEPRRVTAPTRRTPRLQTLERDTRKIQGPETESRALTGPKP